MGSPVRQSLAMQVPRETTLTRAASCSFVNGTFMMPSSPRKYTMSGAIRQTADEALARPGLGMTFVRDEYTRRAEIQGPALHPGRHRRDRWDEDRVLRRPLQRARRLQDRGYRDARGRPGRQDAQGMDHPGQDRLIALLISPVLKGRCRPCR